MREVVAGRPEAGEYDGYYASYIDRVKGEDVVSVLEAQVEELASLLAGIEPSTAARACAPGKWTFAEVIGHLVDSERIFGTRAVRIARGDATPQPGFDQDAYVADARFGERPLEDLADELLALRRANLAMFRNLDPVRWRRTGTANGVPVSVRALAWILAGHAAHHVAVLRERYLSPA